MSLQIQWSRAKFKRLPQPERYLTYSIGISYLESYFFYLYPVFQIPIVEDEIRKAAGDIKDDGRLISSLELVDLLMFSQMK